jgi:threonine dehydrogenase-like Zn-dependent dehydrogenase
MDERIITSPEGESLLIPVGENMSASAVALVEPWACVEDAYATDERTRLKKDGQMLIVADEEISENTFRNFFNSYSRPAQITWLSKYAPPPELADIIQKAANVSKLTDAGFDDVIYFGSEPSTVEALFAKVAAYGLLNIVLCFGRFNRDIATPVGRVHYGGIRIIGSTGFDPAESMELIPDSGEIRDGDIINIIGAAGPMGMMHVIRNICLGVYGVSVFVGDIDDARLAKLTKIAEPLARKNGVEYWAYNPGRAEIMPEFDYIILMVPAPDLVVESVRSCNERGIINIFAGIPETATGKIDLDNYIEKQLYFIGTSGSVLEDMRRVLTKVESGWLNTNVSVAAVCGLDAAAEGIRAVENRSIAGKIIVYPACRGLKLIRLEELNEKMPEVAGGLDNGLWTKQAENTLLEMYKNS